MSPSFSHGARGQVYRYYVSSTLQRGGRRRTGDEIRRVPAAATEKLLETIMHRLLPDQARERLSLLIRVEIHASSLQLLMPVKLLARLRERVSEDEQVERDHDDPTLLRLTIPIRIQLRGGRTCIIGGEKQPTRRDPVLIKALRSAQGLLQMDGRGLPRLQATPTSPYLAKLVRLALLAPDIQEAILAGRQPPGLTLEQLVRGQIPPGWPEQRRVFGFAA